MTKTTVTKDKREGLRELQARLASRLQAARSEGSSVSWLAVKAGKGNLLLPLGQSGEIHPLTVLQKVPYTVSWFKGVLNIRGGLFGVLSVREFLEVETRTNLSDQQLVVQGQSVVTMNSSIEVNSALLVDVLVGLRGPGDFQTSHAADPGSPGYFGSKFIDANGESWQEINLRQLSKTPAFLNISVQ